MNECSWTFRPSPLWIGPVRIDPPLILAPMAGVTDAAFRRVAAEHGAGMVTSEMISVEGLRREMPATWKLARQEPRLSVPMAVQIFGVSPEAAAEAARRLEDRGAPIIDINAGCPVRKVVRQGAGAALLRDPVRLIRLVEAVHLQARHGMMDAHELVGLKQRVAHECGPAGSIHQQRHGEHGVEILFAGARDAAVFVERVRNAGHELPVLR
ncbi:MAG: hypothetical protein HGB17_05675, partial [Syntrophobacteraceae bacterium]|nr:hypothetical protein [Syntrophobacteraceae bacterium]